MLDNQQNLRSLAESFNNPYQDILHLPHFKDPAHPPLSRSKRAAQFMPFKSLSTYETQIEQQFHDLTNQRLEPFIDYSDSQTENFNLTN